MRHAPAVFLGLFLGPLLVIKAGKDDGVVDTLLGQIFFLQGYGLLRFRSGRVVRSSFQKERRLKPKGFQRIYDMAEATS